EGADVVQLAAGGGAAVELGTVPGGQAALMEAARAVEHAIVLAEHGVRRAVAVARMRLLARHRLAHRADVDRRGGTGVAHARRVQPAGRVVALVVHARRRAGTCEVGVLVVAGGGRGRRRAGGRRRYWT